MKKVVAGMSGGVDSSVAAAILKNEYEVIGVTLRMQGGFVNMEGNDAGPQSGDIADAEKVCQRLGIRHEIIDLSESFGCCVKQDFADEYLKGRTPNPCIICNTSVKWAGLMAYADKIGAEMVATGHYAYIRSGIFGNGTEKRYTLKTADSKKDQTYALCMLTQEQLSRTVMPLGALTKEEVRAKAGELGLEISEKPDSMEICFIPDNDHAAYIEKYTGKKSTPGSFVDTEGNILGEHKGIIHYTVGQRKGLGIAFGKPMFVKEIRPETNEVVLCENEELFVTEVYAEKVNYMGIPGLAGGESIRGTGKIRYSHKGEECSIIRCGAGIKAVFDRPVRAVTPGQCLVVYDHEGNVLLGGYITK